MRAIGPWLTTVCTGGFVLALASCAPAADPDRLIPPPPSSGMLPCSTSVEASDGGEIGPGGGELRAGRARLHVPPGALPGSVRFRLAQQVAPYLLVNATPDGQRFQGSGAVLTLSYADCAGPLPPADSVAVFRWNPATRQWDELATRAGPGNREVMAELEHLSGYTIGTNRDGG